MELSKIKIIADSSADIPEISDIAFESVPLKIITAEKEYVDDKNLDVKQMVNELFSYNGKSSTSCPNESDYLSAFGEAQYVFCITITATLSGSYNAAMMAKRTYEEEHPDRKVFVLNSLSTGPEMVLFIEKIKELALEGFEFEEVCSKLNEYSGKTGLIFMLESMKNLANNGRVSPLVAKMAGLLGIRVVGRASEVGDLQTLSKCRGEAKALDYILETLKTEGLRSGKVIISHCFNKKAAFFLRELIHSKLPMANVKITTCSGLCCFYAEKGGMLVGFEKN